MAASKRKGEKGGRKRMRNMPVKNKMNRITVSLPAAMVEEVDRICASEKMFGYNRQQFVESAVRKLLIETKTFRSKMKETES
jgi:metal-responsive CopG/Arc/MetJ family transcriptional regulator